MKKAFTLLEILIVIAILGILIATFVHFLGNTDSAHAAKCKANLKNLANAVSAASINVKDDIKYPLAGSFESCKMTFRSGGGRREVYSEYPGWISWYSDGAYQTNPGSHTSGASWFVSTYNQDEETREYCLTNGTLYAHINNASSYVCPGHLKACDSKPPIWSYVMNGYFRYDTSEGSDTIGDFYPGIAKSQIDASKTLLFAELQWEDNIGINPDFSEGSGFKNDCTLQYKENDGGEIIGFNHKSGNDIVAHIVFADGSVGEIIYPKEGMSENELRELTEYLCEGVEYEIKGGSVEPLDR